jgi:glutamate 5-kinase
LHYCGFFVNNNSQFITDKIMQELQNSKRVIIKIGSSLIINAQTGRCNSYWLAGLAKDVVELRNMGKQILIVCSGSVALGRQALGLGSGVITQPVKQAAAACGQIMQMRIWQEVFAEDNIAVAQVLLTIDDSEVRKRFLNAKNTLNTLLELGAVPIINENDTVATSEMRVGDNDRLSARVAQMVGADLLILFSDVAGIYDANPQQNPNAKLLKRIEKIDDIVRSYATPPTSNVGTGGMITKVQAAEIATNSGCHTVIALGTTHRPLSSLLLEAEHSVFVASTNPSNARKEWIAGSLSASGKIILDSGAVAALQAGGSLLPVGVIKVDGSFNRADTVGVYCLDGRMIARGLVAYDSEELLKITGVRSSEIALRLGYERGDVLIHRDDLVMFSG